jgi:hypothetical protein
MTDLTVRPYLGEDAAAWKAHLAASNNGTLFHDLDVLAYHPDGKFDFHNLVVLKDDRLRAVIPGALLRDGVFASPSGASVGGPVVRKSLGAEDAVNLVTAVQDYARSQGWHGLEFTQEPSVRFLKRLTDATV